MNMLVLWVTLAVILSTTIVVLLVPSTKLRNWRKWLSEKFWQAGTFHTANKVWLRAYFIADLSRKTRWWLKTTKRVVIAVAILIGSLSLYKVGHKTYHKLSKPQEVLVVPGGWSEPITIDKIIEVERVEGRYARYPNNNDDGESDFVEERYHPPGQAVRHPRWAHKVQFSAREKPYIVFVRGLFDFSGS